MIKSLAFALLPFISVALAQAPLYGQCGGQGWTGPTTCVSGSTCVFSNPWYSQCLPGSSTQSQTTTRTTTTTMVTNTGTGTTTSPTNTQTSGSRGNPYADGYNIWLTPFYASEVTAAAAQITDSTQKAKALTVAKIPTFTWFDVIAKVPTLSTYLASAKAAGGKQLVQIVVYDLPDRDCAAAASNGEFSIANGGAAHYKEYIDGIATAIKAYPDVRVVAVIEPDSLANMVTNMNVTKCANAASTYRSSTIYALQQLNLPNVWMYLDAGHAGWLGWPANLQPAANEFASLYNSAGKPAAVRGLATNVANFNALNAARADPKITQSNPNYDESHYINALSPLLTNAGFPAKFIVDQARSGVQEVRNEWGEWCNVDNTGFGTRPTTNTGSSLIDAIVWVKPGGESDGTSNTSAARYDLHCGVATAKKPAPEAGTWFQAYFAMLVKNANPPL